MQQPLEPSDHNNFSLEVRVKRRYYDTRTFFSRYSIPYLPLKKWEYARYKRTFGLDPELEGIRWGVVHKNTDIAIEGFPRSGNTFASVAFRYAQQKETRMAYRLHAPIQLIEARRLNIPAIVLIRKPEDAVLSWVIHRPHITIPLALQGYIRFYERVLPYLDDLVVAEFNTVVSDFNQVIQGVNQKWNLHFDGFTHTEEHVNNCFQLIDEFYKKTGKGKVPEQIVARPSADRKQLKQTLKHAYKADQLTAMRDYADQLYQKFL